MPASDVQQSAQSETNGTSSDEMSSDDELPLIFVDEEPQRHATLERYEVQKTEIRTELDRAPKMTEKELLAMEARFEALANAVRRYGVNVRIVGQDHILFLFFEDMWEIAKIIRMRLHGDLDVKEGLPKYSRGATYIRMILLNAYKFAPLEFIWIPLDRSPFPDHYYDYSSW